MDIFITIISWIGGFALFGLLGLIFVFSSTAHRQPGESSIDIVTLASLALMLWLLWMGGASIYHIAGSTADAYVNKPQQSSSVAKTATAGTQQSVTTDTVDKSDEKDDLQMQILFILATLPFLIWLLSPSDQEDKKKELVRKKLMATVALEKDESGTRPWDPHWKPADDHSENNKK